MTTKTSAILIKRMNAMERNFQELKVDLLLDLLKKKQEDGFYQESEILNEVKKTRKNLWNEKYSKTI